MLGKRFWLAFVALSGLLPLLLPWTGAKPRAPLGGTPATGSPGGGLTSPAATGVVHEFDVVDVRTLNLTKYQRYVLSSVEGVVNKDASRLYLVVSDTSSKWLEYLNSTSSGPYSGVELAFDNLSALVDHYQSLGYFQGVVTFDGDDPDEANLASPLAGVYRSLLVPSQVYGEFGGSLPVVTNVTAALADCPSRVAKYRYALEHYYPICNQSAFALFGGDSPGNLRGFIVANDLFTLWQPLYVPTDVPNGWGAPSLDPDPAEERQLFEEFLADTPADSPVFGYMWPDGANEGVVIKLISEANKYLIPADWVENLPFLDHMELPAGYEFAQNRSAPTPPLENKVYVAGVWSDGDNIQYVYGFMRNVLWDSADVPHGQVPTGWTVNPSLYELAPYVLKYFYETATPNDYFLGGLSGKGYCKMDYFTDAGARAKFLTESQELYDLTDITDARIWQLEGSAAEVTRFTNVTGIYDGYGGPFQYQQPRVVGGTPIIMSVGVSNDSSAPVEFVRHLSTVNPQRPLFVFFHLHCWTCTTAIWTRVAHDLQGLAGVEVVRPDVLSQLVQEWGGDEFEGGVAVANAILTFSGLTLLGYAVHREGRPPRGVDPPAIGGVPSPEGAGRSGGREE
ncbi:MAG: GxGYxYP domain-containing protein [Promethearchaeota archaeon]